MGVHPGSKLSNKEGMPAEAAEMAQVSKLPATRRSVSGPPYLNTALNT